MTSQPPSAESRRLAAAAWRCDGPVDGGPPARRTARRARWLPPVFLAAFRSAGREKPHCRQRKSPRPRRRAGSRCPHRLHLQLVWRGSTAATATPASAALWDTRCRPATVARAAQPSRCILAGRAPWMVPRRQWGQDAMAPVAFTRAEHTNWAGGAGALGRSGLVVQPTPLRRGVGQPTAPTPLTDAVYCRMAFRSTVAVSPVAATRGRRVKSTGICYQRPFLCARREGAAFPLPALADSLPRRETYDPTFG